MRSDGYIPQTDSPHPGAYAKAAAIADAKGRADATHDLRWLVAATVPGDATPTRRSDAASRNELHTDIEAAEPYCECTGPMPEVRTVAAERIDVAKPLTPSAPPIPVMYLAMFTLTTPGGLTFWCCGNASEQLEKVMRLYRDYDNVRLVRIPGGAA